MARTFEIDAVLHDIKALIIFEIKATWLREDTILDDYEKLIRQIRLRYGANLDSSGGIGKPKGVAQLSRIIRAIARREWAGPDGQFADATVIYPVLLVHDKRMDAPGTGQFLAAEFISLLGANNLKARVAPLTVMTIEDLEILESSIGGFSLRELLSDYTREVPDGFLSLHNFMASTYADKLRPSLQLRTKSEELLIHARQALFPVKSDVLPDDKEARVRERAYAIWEQLGRPEGKDSEHWLQAEAEMEAEGYSTDVTASAAAVAPTSSP